MQEQDNFILEFIESLNVIIKSLNQSFKLIYLKEEQQLWIYDEVSEGKLYFGNIYDVIDRMALSDDGCEFREECVDSKSIINVVDQVLREGSDSLFIEFNQNDNICYLKNSETGNFLIIGELDNINNNCVKCLRNDGSTKVNIDLLLDRYSTLKNNDKIKRYVSAYLKKNKGLFEYVYIDFLVPLFTKNYLSEITEPVDKNDENIFVIQHLINVSKKSSILNIVGDAYFYDKDIDDLNIAPILDFNRFLRALETENLINDSCYEDGYCVNLILLKYIYELLNEEFKEKILKAYELESDKDILYYADKIYSMNSNIEMNKLIAMCCANKNINNNGAELFYDYHEKYCGRIQKIIEQYKNHSYLNSLLKDDDVVTLDNIDLMSGYEFESFIAQLFKNLEYQVDITKSSGDQGADIIIEKNNERTVIQTKCYTYPVGNKAIQEVVSSKKIYNANKAMVITNSLFTKSAIQLAKANSVILWDRNILKEKISGY